MGCQCFNQGNLKQHPTPISHAQMIALTVSHSNTVTLIVFGASLTKKVAVEELLAVNKEESFFLVSPC